MKRPHRRVIDWTLTHGLPEEFADRVPSTYWRYGTTIILNFNPGIPEQYERIMAKGWVKVLGARSALKRRGFIMGTYREPEMERLYGPGGDVIHLENGVRYCFDPEKIMFARGNQRERMRMGRLDLTGETVVDMFSGIGYFSLPMALRTGAERIYACELNPLAYHYLCKNIGINGVANLTPLEGDNRDTAPEGIADRVIMGYLGTTHLFLTKAFSCLRDKGIIHYHEVCPMNHYPIATQRRIERAAYEIDGIEVSMVRNAVVKKYGPRMLHVVVDINVEKDI